MITQISVSESLVKLPILTTKLEELFRNAQPSKKDRDQIVLLAIEIQRHSNHIASWALHV